MNKENCIDIQSFLINDKSDDIQIVKNPDEVKLFKSKDHSKTLTLWWLMLF